MGLDLKNLARTLIPLIVVCNVGSTVAAPEPDPGKTAEFFGAESVSPEKKAEICRSGLQYGWYAIDRGYVYSAEGAFTKVTELDPSSAEAWFGLARISKIQKHDRESEAYYKKATALDARYASKEYKARLNAPYTVPSPHTPRKDAIACTQIGWQAYDRKDYARAIQFFQEATKYDPSYAPGYFGVAYVYSIQNKIAEAIPLYRETIKRAPTFPDAHGNLARALLMTGNPTEAERELQEALRLDPKLGNAVMNFAYYYVEKNNWEKAKSYAQDAVSRGAVLEAEVLEEFKKHGIDLAR